MTGRPDRVLLGPRGAGACSCVRRACSGVQPLAAHEGAMTADALSDVLRTVRLSGAVFFVVDASSPWGIEVPDGATLAPAVLPRAQHVISYHVVTAGSCWGEVAGGAPVRLETGDVLVFPHGSAYVIALAPGMRGGPAKDEVLEFLRDMGAGRLPFTVAEGGGGAERLQLVCGFLGCDLRPFNPLLATLPPLLHVRAASAGTGDPLSRLIEITLAEARAPRAGGDCVRLRLSELMFVEVVRRHLGTLDAEETGWLAGLRDPTVGRALVLLHDRPGQSWTLDRLAREAGLSRSALAERFAQLVGEPPMHYLARWRLQLAARMLCDGAAKVSAVAAEVGYESEAAFSRAFKKLSGVAPAEWRARHGEPPRTTAPTGGRSQSRRIPPSNSSGRIYRARRSLR